MLNRMSWRIGVVSTCSGVLPSGQYYYYSYSSTNCHRSTRQAEHPGNEASTVLQLAE